MTPKTWKIQTMFFNEEKTDQPFFIRKIDQQGILINETVYQHSLIIANHDEITRWELNSLDQIKPSDFDWFDQKPFEVIIIGTGQLTQPLPLDIRKWFIQKQLPIEVMTSKTAAQTYNILASDHRNVGLALIFDW